MAAKNSTRGAGSRTIAELPEPRHASLRRLHAYWLAKKGAARAPPRSAIHPEEIVDLLPNLALVDVIGEPPRFRVRLFGTILVAAYGQDITGRFIDEIDLDTIGPDLDASLRAVVRDWRPHVMRVQLIKAEDRRHIEYERIWLPLSSDNQTVNMLLGGIAVETAYAPLDGQPPPLPPRRTPTP
jgi:hypothetical protein